MIELSDITKNYGHVTALRHVSFTVPDGQILGLLGRNGAGKTTALNIMTGYLPPTSGTVRVNGLDILTRARECKRLIGYLPEKPPLYDEMTVTSYLSFVCRLREVRASAVPEHIRGIMELTGLTEVSERLLGHLSRGYRQRVGVAQALCGNPPVLVLDEPTVGLDPKQVAEIRDLIRRLGQSHTVIFSSHLLSEVQQLCDRVIILHKGSLIRNCDLSATNGTEEELRLHLAVQMEEKALLSALRSLDCIHRIQLLSAPEPDVTELRLTCAPGNDRGDVYTQLFHLLTALDAPIRMLCRERDSLEEIFLRATEEE